jgi:hypothetical protein
MQCETLFATEVNHGTRIHFEDIFLIKHMEGINYFSVVEMLHCD